MTRLSFRALGLVAVALIALAGYTSAERLDFYITGANPVQLGGCYLYNGYQSGTKIPVTITGWTVTGNGTLVGSNSTSAQVRPTTSSGTYTVSGSRPGHGGPFGFTVTINGNAPGEGVCPPLSIDTE